MPYETLAPAIRSLTTGIPAQQAIFLLQRSRYCIALLTAICAVVFFYGLGDLRLWDIDEGMHAVMARNMVITGDWVTPLFNGEPFFDKPAMYNWLTALSFSILGFTEFAARLPSALLGTGCVVLTYLAGKAVYGRAAGFLAGVMLATSLEFIIVSRMVIYEVPFTFFTTLSLYLFCLAVLHVRLRRLLFLGFYAAVALAVLTKGLLGVFLPGLAIVSWLLIRRDWSFLREMQILSGMLVFVAIVSPWFFMMEKANPGYLEYFVMKQHVANLIGTTAEYRARHPEPFYYFLPVLFLGLFPWSALLFGALRDALRKMSHESSLTLFLLAWLIGNFFFFSAATSKLSTYILPVFPAAALLLGRYITAAIAVPADRLPKLIERGLAATLLMLLALASWVLLFDPWTHWRQEAGLDWQKFEHFILLLVTMNAALLFMAHRRWIASLFATSALLSPAIVLAVGLYLAPDLQPFKSSASIGEVYNRLLPAGARMAFFDRMMDSALFYTGRDADVLHSTEALEDFLSQDERVYVLLRNREQGSSICRSKCYVIAEEGNKVVVSNQANAAAAGAQPKTGP
ncbi:MAG: glycosyltransferase family 39 protein [Gammaproteobacteria bacterium]|nr:glycosyltransferase family 39 protein [Gammaproteobacteria bacterium]MDH4316577.1 glycosyltransferase family 39 protein [Gammaproteobacteria bacterium]MDH5215924.1 glycosyltransferase family 39 protein [Gammaproteobacteria bacterium]